MYFRCLSRKMNVHTYHSKGLGKSFPLMWLNIGLCIKIIKIRASPVLVSHPKQVQNYPNQRFCFLHCESVAKIERVYFEK